MPYALVCSESTTFSGARTYTLNPNHVLSPGSDFEGAYHAVCRTCVGHGACSASPNGTPSIFLPTFITANTASLDPRSYSSTGSICEWHIAIYVHRLVRYCCCVMVDCGLLTGSPDAVLAPRPPAGTYHQEYLDFVAGISTCALGHADPDLAAAVSNQMKKFHHVSNLYYIPEQVLSQGVGRVLTRCWPGVST